MKVTMKMVKEEEKKLTKEEMKKLKESKKHFKETFKKNQVIEKFLKISSDRTLEINALVSLCFSKSGNTEEALKSVMDTFPDRAEFAVAMMSYTVIYNNIKMKQRIMSFMDKCL